MNIEDRYDSDQFGANLMIFHASYKKYINDEVSKFDLSFIQGLCLVLIDREGNLNQKSIADMLFLTKGAITKAVNKLVDDGLVYREKFSEDKRSYVLNSTEKGKEIVPKLMEINRRWEHAMGLEDLPPEFEDIFKHLAIRSIELNLK